MQSATSTNTARRSKQQSRELDQFDLFASVPVAAQLAVEMFPANSCALAALTQPDPEQSSAVARHVELEARILPPKIASRQSRRKPVEVYIVAEGDLPDYSDTEKAIVDCTLEALPQTKAWFTYADIRQAFTISRATVVRRVKSGVVPGIRFAGDRVLEDGSIRRFTREQVRYLLLSIRRPVR